VIGALRAAAGSWRSSSAAAGVDQHAVLVDFGRAHISVAYDYHGILRRFFPTYKLFSLHPDRQYSLPGHERSCILKEIRAMQPPGSGPLVIYDGLLYWPTDPPGRLERVLFYNTQIRKE
jgi:hypothetical protein